MNNCTVGTSCTPPLVEIRSSAAAKVLRKLTTRWHTCSSRDQNEQHSAQFGIASIKVQQQPELL